MSRSLQAVIGITGPQGPQGVTGPAGGGGGGGGATGIQGVTGLLGLQGFTGLSGSNGSQGSTGVLGLQGVTGFGIQGVTGLSGTNGSQGTTGLSGAGIQGVTGLIGATGPVGGGSGAYALTYLQPSVATGYVSLLVTGSSSDILNIVTTKVGNLVTITSVSGTAKLLSITAQFTASDMSSASATVSYPEPNGSSAIATSTLPLVERYTAAYTVGATSVTIGNSSGVITVTGSGFTIGAAASIKIAI